VTISKFNLKDLHKIKLIVFCDNIFRTKCKKKNFSVKFRIISVFGVSGVGYVRKRDSREDYENRFGTNGIIMLLRAREDIHREKGFHCELLRKRY